MKTIELTQNFFAMVDDRDFNKLNRWSWFVWIPKSLPHLVYAVRKVRKDDGGYTKILMHRQIMGAKPGEEIDHWDGNTLNNRRRNLRFATDSQNQANARQHRDAGSSKYKGVTWHKGSQKWQASVQCQKQRFYVGWFSCEKDAARAYNRKAEELFGPYARLNQI